MGLIDTVFCRINLVVGVRICGKCLWIYDLVRKAASDDKCILDGEKREYQYVKSGVGDQQVEIFAYADNIPLALGIEKEEQLSEVMDETSDLHPLGLTITTDGLSGLE